MITEGHTIVRVTPHHEVVVSVAVVVADMDEMEVADKGRQEGTTLAKINQHMEMPK